VRDTSALREGTANALRSSARYAAAVTNVLPRRGARDLRRRLLSTEQRLVFVVGSPRSGTTFVGTAIGAVPGFVDLGEVTPLKAAIPRLVELDDGDAAVQLRGVLERVRRLALVRGLRGVEQTPETAFVLGAALQAYPAACAVHVVRDGRDVVCSLLERGWLSARRGGSDDAGLPFGSRARFWVEPGRRDEFEAASDATRAAWAWRTYVAAGRAGGPRTLEVRYESLVGDPGQTAAAIAGHLDVDPQTLSGGLARAHDRSVGRFQRELTAEQLADVEREAGQMLGELGYLS
jgi:Sulfotransferase family